MDETTKRVLDYFNAERMQLIISLVTARQQVETLERENEALRRRVVELEAVGTALADEVEAASR